MEVASNRSEPNPDAVTTAALGAAFLIFVVNALISLGAFADGSWGMIFLIVFANPIANAVMAVIGLCCTPLVKSASGRAPLGPYLVAVLGMPVLGVVYQFLSAGLIHIRGGC